MPLFLIGFLERVVFEAFFAVDLFDALGFGSAPSWSSALFQCFGSASVVALVAQFGLRSSSSMRSSMRC